MAESIRIHLEFTPNPNTLKFVVSQRLLDRGALNFLSPDQAAGSLLAQKLFKVPGVDSLLIGTNFVTITKSAQGDWDVLASEIPKTIEQHFKSGEPIVDPNWKWEEAPAPSGPSSEIERKIREVLDNEIRPAVAMDGGDIQFGKYENGIVYLHLQGSCSACPSSIMTLKMGVETRLKDAVPEIKEVVQV